MEIRYGFDSRQLKEFGKMLLKYSTLKYGSDYLITCETDTEVVVEVMPSKEQALRNRICQMDGIYEIITA